MKKRIQAVACEKKKRAGWTEKGKRNAAALMSGLDRKTGLYRADMALRTFSWEE